MLNVDAIFLSVFQEGLNRIFLNLVDVVAFLVVNGQCSTTIKIIFKAKYPLWKYRCNPEQDFYVETPQRELSVASYDCAVSTEDKTPQRYCMWQ